ncbi:MAG TPA: glycosyltransferase [Acidobacteriota bacterium]|nr:glycosyltransferase [Acidobacteriota bacterium]HQF86740.1 glycosyltransferase [Acidobacteriota bacterium]HQG91462.1 glycosyltransferase [Acidobacteriota bacterium]HQK89126.1 glycosyltransferase [Acidobacteriota bacterium]
MSDRLYEHFAAGDLAVVPGGGATMLELAALRRPFIYFPPDEHFEQQPHVTHRLDRHEAGYRLNYPGTTPDTLAELIVSEMTTPNLYPPIPTDGACRAATVLAELLPSARR